MAKKYLSLQELKSFIKQIEESNHDLDISQVRVDSQITNGFAAMNAPMEVVSVNKLQNGEIIFTLFGGTKVPGE